MTPWINKGEPYFDQPFIKKAEAHYNATYVGDFAIKGTNGWGEQPVAVFYNPNHAPEHKPYFGLFVRNASVYICDATSTVGVPIYGAQAADGEIIYSRYRHDFRQSQDGTVTIDGGRDYTTYSGTSEPVMLAIEKGEVVIVADPDQFLVVYELSKA